MGWSHKYKCDNCGHEQQFYEGYGWFGIEEAKRQEKLSEEFRQEALDGKFGEEIQKKAGRGVVRFSRDKVTFQCEDCKYTDIYREKHILFDEEENEIEIPQRCPKCGGDNFKRLKDLENSDVIYCPECKQRQLRIREFGCWD